MKNSLSHISVVGLLCFFHQFSNAFCQEADLERLAILPFEARGVATNQLAEVRQRFVDAVGESKRFEIMADNVLRNNLDQAGLKKMDSCNTVPCLAELGKVLNVEKIVHVSVDQWQDRFVLNIRLVRPSDGVLLYAERADYRGEFKDFLANIVPEQGRRMSHAYLDKGTRWYLIAGAVLIGVGLICWIYKTFASVSGSDPQAADSPSTAK